MNRETRIGVALVAGLGLFVFSCSRSARWAGFVPELTEYPVGEILAEQNPAIEHGSAELRIVGWYAELAGDCSGDNGGIDASVAWLQRDCPLRVLLRSQPAETVTQAELLRDGLRLAAPNGRPFPQGPSPAGRTCRDSSSSSPAISTIPPPGAAFRIGSRVAGTPSW